MKPFDLCRQPAGTVFVYDFDTPEDRTVFNARLSAAGSKVGAKLERLSINGFDTSTRPPLPAQGHRQGDRSTEEARQGEVNP